MAVRCENNVRICGIAVHFDTDILAQYKVDILCFF